jgi:TP901 family phage tail tape measure protein
MADGIGQIGQAADKGGIKLRTFGDKIKTVFDFRAISEGFMLLRTGISDGVTAIIDYDQALKDLQAITGATNTEVAQMGTTILEVASRTKFSAAEVAAGMRTLGQAGFSAAEAVQTMQSVSDLATGTLSDMSQTVDLMTTAMRVFQIDASRSAEVSDVFANAVNRSKLTIEKLRTSMNYVGPVANNINVSFQETSAAMMTLANSGLRASTIGTSLRQVLAQLAAPSKKFRDAAKLAGIAMQELDPTTNSLSTVLANLRLVVQDTGTAFDIFGKRGASAAIALTSTNSQYDSLLDTVSKTGTAAEMAAKQMEGLGVSFKNLRDKVGNLAIALGKGGITTVMRLFVDGARAVIDVLTMLAETTLGRFIIQITVTTTVVGALVGTFIALKSAIAGTALAAFLGTIVTTTRAVWAAVVATQAWNAAIAANPFGRVAIAVAALITGLVLLFNKLTSGTKKSAENLLITADELGNLSKKILDAQVSLVSLEEGTNEYKQTLISLKETLRESAKGTGELADQALKAYNSIDTLNGKFSDGGTAVEKYRTELNKLQIKKLTDNFKIAAKEFQKSTEEMFDRDQVARGENKNTLFGLFEEGKISVKELQHQIDSFDVDNITKEQKKQQEQLNFLRESSRKLFQELQKLNEVNMDMTTEDFKNFAASLGLSQTQMKFLVAEFNRVKDASVSARNILEKWSEDPSSLKLAKNVETLENAYSTLGNVISKEQKKELEGLEDIRRKRVEAFEKLKRPSPGASEAEWLNFYAKEQEILNQVNKDRAEVSKNTFAQLIVDLDDAAEAHSRKLKEINVSFKDNTQERARQTVQADQTLADKRIKIYKEFVEKISGQSEGIAEKFELDLDSMGSEFSKLERESEKAWKNVSEHSNNAFETQERAVGDWLTTIQNKMSAVSSYTQSTFSTLGSNLLTALKFGASEDTLSGIQEAIKDTTDAGAEYYEDMGNSIGNVLDFIADQESRLLNNIQTYANQALSVQQKVQNLLFSIDQERMDDLERYQSNKLRAEELMAQAEQKRYEAESLAGKEREQAFEQSKALYEESFSYVQKLTASRKQEADFAQKAIKEREEAGRKEKELTQLVSDEKASLEDVKRLKEEIAGHYKKETEYKKKQKEFDAQVVEQGKSEKDRKELALKYEKGILDLYERRTELDQEELEGWDAKKKKVNELKDRVEDLVKFLKEGASFKLDFTDARNNLKEFEKELKGLLSDPMSLNFASDSSGLDTTDQDIMKIGDTWTNVWVRNQEVASGVINTIDTELQNLSKENKVNIDFTGSGSETLPISEKIESIKSMVLDLMDKEIEIPIILKGIEKATRQIKDLLKNFDKLKDKTVTVTTKYRTVGAPAGYAKGGKLPGFGGGDRHPILAESGEWIINKFAVRKFGDAFMSSINNMTLPKFKDGGKVGASLASSVQNTGTSVLDSLSNFGTVNLTAGDMSVPAIVHSNVVNDLNVHLNKMRRFRT